MLSKFFPLFLLFGLLFACSDSASKEDVDSLIVAKEIYLSDTARAEAMVLKDGKVLATGSQAELESRYKAKATKIFQDMFIYPGLNDAHAHFVGYARGLGRVDLMGTESWEQCIERVLAFADANQTNFIIGRGWDQNDWEVKEFPTRTILDSLFPNTPVVLHRVDGHAAIANGAALNYAKISSDTLVAGGALIQEKGVLTGVLIDNAVDLIEEPILSVKKEKALILRAQEYCLRAGLTSITDAGLKRREIEILQELIEQDSLKIRLNLMVSDDSASLAYYFKHEPIEGPRLRVRTVKFYLDGALGSRGALLLQDYADDPGNRGLQLKPSDYFYRMADSLSHAGWQMAIHAIGDSANRLATYIFGIGYMHNPDHRWRIEHAQIVHPKDLQSMKELKLIPSIQPTHATSDMYWAEDRLGADRIGYAYPAKDFLDAGLVVPLGTDFPVEDINPMYTLRAARFRQDEAGYPPGGFRPDQALSFEEAIKGMTWSGAYASFEEEVKGLLEPGYYADFIVVAQDLSEVPVEKLGSIEIRSTAINGEFLYGL